MNKFLIKAVVFSSLSFVLACGSRYPAPPAGAVVISAKEYAFMPSSITLKANQPVTLFITNDGTADHDLKSDIPLTGLTYAHAGNDADEQTENIKNNELDVDFAKNNYAQVTFTPTKAGTYEFTCDETGHLAQGMKGSFVVQ